MSFLDRSFTNVFDISNHPRLKVFSKRGRRVKGCWWRITEPRGVQDHRSTEGSVPAEAVVQYVAAGLWAAEKYW
jgi:hypothetical protein